MRRTKTRSDAQPPTDTDEAIWPFRWLSSMPGALPPAHISQDLFPKVFAWVARYEAAVRACLRGDGKAVSIDGATALTQTIAADFAESDVTVAQGDPSGLVAGQTVELWPIDSGSKHHDRGVLVGLTSTEVVIECETKIPGKVIRAHAPRHGFRIVAVSPPKAGL